MRKRINTTTSLAIGIAGKTSNKDHIPQKLIELLQGGELSIGDLSRAIGKSEKELHGYIDSLRQYKTLTIIPAECLKCGFVFEGRNKAKKPGKCPKCKGSHIDEPLFAVK